MSHFRTAVVAVAFCVARVAGAQNAADHVALGDREFAALNAKAALQHYEAAVAADPRDYEALWKASRSAVDLGENTTAEADRFKLFKDGERYARRAVAANPGDAEGHFVLARALGRTALSLGTRDRIKYAGEVRAQALEALKYDPKHAGALHVMGVWNAEVMRLNGFSRMIAKNFLGGQVFGSASWGEARRYMEEAVRVDPVRLTHKLDLGEIYSDIGEKAKARDMYQQVVNGRATELNDPIYKRRAAAALKSL
jgi:tetratricopeptide (TPR) repeat protein